MVRRHQLRQKASKQPITLDLSAYSEMRWNGIHIRPVACNSAFISGNRGFELRRTIAGWGGIDKLRGHFTGRRLNTFLRCEAGRRRGPVRFECTSALSRRRVPAIRCCAIFCAAAQVHGAATPDRRPVGSRVVRCDKPAISCAGCSLTRGTSNNPSLGRRLLREQTRTGAFMHINGPIGSTADAIIANSNPIPIQCQAVRIPQKPPRKRVFSARLRFEANARTLGPIPESPVSS